MWQAAIPVLASAAQGATQPKQAAPIDSTATGGESKSGAFTVAFRGANASASESTGTSNDEIFRYTALGVLLVLGIFAIGKMKG